MSAPRPAPGSTLRSLTYGEVAVGDELPTLEVPITRTLIVSGAIASRDYQDVHHDTELARSRGSKDIFMNILTTNGLVGRYVTDWSGPCSVLRDVAIRLGVPNYPHDVMTFSGVVSARRDPGPGDRHGEVEVTVRGANGLGDHVTGTVTVALPVAAGGELGGPPRGAGGSGERGTGQ